MAFDPLFKNILDYIGINGECRHVLQSQYNISDFATLEGNQTRLVDDNRGAFGSPGFAEVAGILLSLLEYVDLFGSSSPECRSKMINKIPKGHDFLFWLATGMVASALPRSIGFTTQEVDDDPEYRPQKKLRLMDIGNNELSPEELAALCEQIKGSSWSYQPDDKAFYLPFNDRKVGMPAGFFKILFDHQRDGIEWVISLFEKGKGGILADDMGLGKTLQSLCCISMLIKAGVIKNSLVVAPKTVAYNWKKEAERFVRNIVPNAEIDLITSDTPDRFRNKILRTALLASRNDAPDQPGHIVIAPYSLVSRHLEKFKLSRCRWGCLILDECHQVKTPSAKQSVACKVLCSSWATHKLLLTGTPIPNRLMELWNLTNTYISKDLLGTQARFKEYYVKPIEAGHENAPMSIKRCGDERSKELQKIMSQFILRRTKEEKLRLPKKSVNILWFRISPKQRQLYKECTTNFSFHSAPKPMVESNVQPCSADSSKEEATAVEPRKPNKEFLALQLLNRVRRICSHPLLLKDHGDKDGNEKSNKAAMTMAHASQGLDILKESPKLSILCHLIDRFKSQGNRTLIASQYTSTLDLVEVVLTKKNLHITRIDGKTAGEKRILIADRFNEGMYDVLLLSTKAAGVGINLVGADRVVIFDPDWTPANDNQAMDRAHRPGQCKRVEVYFLIAAGTVEEKMVEIHMHKDGIHHSVMAHKNQMSRLYEKHNPSELFDLSPPGESKVFDKLEAMGLTWTQTQQKALLDHPAIHGVSKHGAYAKHRTTTTRANSPHDVIVHEKHDGVSVSAVAPAQVSCDSDAENKSSRSMKDVSLEARNDGLVERGNVGFPPQPVIEEHTL